MPWSEMNFGFCLGRPRLARSSRAGDRANGPGIDAGSPSPIRIFVRKLAWNLAPRRPVAFGRDDLSLPVAQAGIEIFQEPTGAP
jgi:hypothetical protein